MLEAAQQTVLLSLGKAIVLLRKRLGLRQEEFAERFGFKLSTLQKWERGRHPPSGPALLRLLALCPDDETRSLFTTAPLQQNPKAAVPEPRLPSNDEEELLRHFSDAMVGLNQIYEAARVGDGGAAELLKHIAAGLVTRGGDWRTMKYLRSRRSKKTE